MISDKEIKRREKISKSLTGYKRSEEEIQKTTNNRNISTNSLYYGLYNLGYTDNEISEIVDTTPNNIAKWRNLKHLLPNHKDINTNMNGHFIIGNIPWTKGIHPDYLQGENHWNWKGGISDASRYSNERRRKITDNGGNHTPEEWELLKEKYNYTCPNCNIREPNIILSKDHIVPISKGGSNDISNIQPLCKYCNSKKHTKVIKYKYR